MNHENPNGVPPVSPGDPERGKQFVNELAEEINFNFGRFLRTYNGAIADPVQLVKRARVLRDSMADFNELLTTIINTYE